MTSNYVIQRKSFDESNYDLREKIGQPGQFGFARKCVDKNGNIYAVKIIDKMKFNSISKKKIFFDQLKNEIKIMKSINHTNIIQFIDYFENKNKLYIVMELCKGGELFDRISNKGSYCEKDAAEIIKQILEGVSYLHTECIVHMDLKPDNFLFFDEREDSVLKIIDFGMSKKFLGDQFMHSLAGTPYYVAPEVLSGKYKKSCDIWSIGIISFVLLFGYPPFYSDPNEVDCDSKIFNKIKRGFIPETKDNYGPWFPKKIKCSDSAKDLITKMLTYDPEKRITAKEALNHSWVLGTTADTAEKDPMVINRLLSFKKSCKLKQAFLNYVTLNLDSVELNKLKTEFEDLDQNKNGRLSVYELQDGFKQINLEFCESEISKIINHLDFDEDGKISYNEWCIAAMNNKLKNKDDRLIKLFNEIDKNKDGKLSSNELKNAFKEINPNFDVYSAISEVDLDGDGNIDFEEFKKMFKDED